VKAGADRQDVHEVVRQASFAAAKQIKEGGDNDLAERLKASELLAPFAATIDEALEPSRHVGRAPEQVLEFRQRRPTEARKPLIPEIRQSPRRLRRRRLEARRGSPAARR